MFLAVVSATCGILSQFWNYSHNCKMCEMFNRDNWCKTQVNWTQNPNNDRLEVTYGLLHTQTCVDPPFTAIREDTRRRGGEDKTLWDKGCSSSSSHESLSQSSRRVFLTECRLQPNSAGCDNSAFWCGGWKEDSVWRLYQLVHLLNEEENVALDHRLWTEQLQQHGEVSCVTRTVILEGDILIIDLS